MVLHTTYVHRSTIKLWCCITIVFLVLAGNSFWCFVNMVLIVKYSCAVVSVFGSGGKSVLVLHTFVNFWYYLHT